MPATPIREDIYLVKDITGANELPPVSPLLPERTGTVLIDGASTFRRVQRTEVSETTGNSGSAIYEEVIAQIKALLQEGQYRPGDRLPSERELAERLGVNRNALREAIRALTVMGVIQTRPQSGSHLSPTVEGMLRLPFEFMMLMLRPSYEQIQELRSLIEVYAAGRAAECRTDDDLQRLEATIEDLRRNNGFSEGGSINREFHRYVAAATQNPLIEHVLNCLLEARSRYIRLLRPATGPRRPENIENHVRILEAIRNRDSEAARLAMLADMGVAKRVGQSIHAAKAAE